MQKYKLAVVTKCTKKVIGEERCQKITFWGFFRRKHLKENQKT
jgi:hypothetical protein